MAVQDFMKGNPRKMPSMGIAVTMLGPMPETDEVPEEDAPIKGWKTCPDYKPHIEITDRED